MTAPTLNAVSDQVLLMASSPSFNNLSLGLTVIATAAGTTTLTVASTGQQLFTGATTQTIVMPLVSTLTTGWPFLITNRSTGNLTIESSGTNTIQVMGPNSRLALVFNGTAGTGTSSWDATYGSTNNSPTFSVITVTKVNGTEAANVVIASGGAGVIATSSLSAGGGATYVITWTNTLITTTSGIALQVVGGTNTTQNITMTCVPGSGSAVLTIFNNTAATALNGTIFISYLVY